MPSSYKRVMNQMHPGEALLKRTEYRLRAEAEAMQAASRRSISQRSGHRSILRRAAMVCAAVLLVLVLPVGGFAYWNTPVAYVDVDINPSVEAAVNGINRVISIKGINQDGQEILAKLDLDGKELTDALKELVQAAKDMGYLKPGMPNAIALSTISLSDVTNSGKKSARLSNAARLGIEEALSGTGIEVELVEQVIGRERVEEARKLQQNPDTSVTTGKLNLIQKLKVAYEENGIEGFDPAVWYKSSIQDILKATKKARGTERDNTNGSDASKSTTPGGKDTTNGSGTGNAGTNQGNGNAKDNNGNGIGNSTGNSDGNNNGNSSGNSDGNNNGNSSGNSDGNNNGNSSGNSDGNNNGNSSGNSDGNNNGNSSGQNDKTGPDGKNGNGVTGNGKNDSGTNNPGNDPDPSGNDKVNPGNGDENNGVGQIQDDGGVLPDGTDEIKDKDPTGNDKDKVKVNPGQTKKEPAADPAGSLPEDPVVSDAMSEEPIVNDEATAGDAVSGSSDELSTVVKDKIKK